MMGISSKNKKAAVAIEEITNTVKQWKIFANEVNVSSKLRDEIVFTVMK